VRIFKTNKVENVTPNSERIIKIILLLSIFLILGNILFAQQDLQDALSSVRNGHYKEAIPVLESYLKKNPNEVELKNILSSVYHNLGVQFYKEKNFIEAENYFRKAIRNNTTSEASYSSLIALLIETKQLPDAKKELQIAVKKFPKSKSLNLALSALQIELKECDAALKNLTRLKEENPDDVETNLMLAKVYIATSKYELADKTYWDALVKNPKEKKIEDEIIKYYQSLNRLDKLREVLEFLSRTYKNADYKMKIAYTYEQENNFIKADSVYLEIVDKDPNNIEALLATAKLCFRNGNNTKAISALLTIKEIEPKNRNALILLNEIYFDQKDFAGTIKPNKDFFSLSPNDFYAVFQLYSAYKQLGIRDSMIYFLEYSYNLDPSDPFVLKEYGDYLLADGKKPEAIIKIKSSLRRSITRLGESQNIILKNLNDQGMNLADYHQDSTESKQKDLKKIEDNIKSCLTFLEINLMPEEFMELLDEYISEFPESPYLFICKAGQLEKKNDYQNAFELYKKVVHINPNLKNVHERMGQILEDQQKYSEALLAYKRMSSLDRKDNKAYSAIIRLSNKLNNLSSLGDEWFMLFKSDTENKILKERLIEVLHKSNRIDEANQVINWK